MEREPRGVSQEGIEVWIQKADDGRFAVAVLNPENYQRIVNTPPVVLQNIHMVDPIGRYRIRPMDILGVYDARIKK